MSETPSPPLRSVGQEPTAYAPVAAVVTDHDDDRYGFRWGPLLVQRYALLPDGRRVLGITTGAGREIDVFVSRTGRSVRIFSGEQEWKP